MEAIVLAGGLGTRLKSVVPDLPKPMALVNGKPFLSYVLDKLIDNKVEAVILSVGYKSEIIREYFGDSYRELDLKYAVEDFPLGTGGAIKKALDLVVGEQVYVLNGDTLFDVDFVKLEECRQKVRSSLIMALKPLKDFDRYGAVAIEPDGRVCSFEEKGFTHSGLINGGVYLMDKDLLNSFSGGYRFSFESDVLEVLTKKNAVFSVTYDSYFVDIGVPEDYERAMLELLDV